jgi:hypothetical protein
MEVGMRGQVHVKGWGQIAVCRVRGLAAGGKTPLCVLALFVPFLRVVPNHTWLQPVLTGHWKREKEKGVAGEREPQ